MRFLGFLGALLIGFVLWGLSLALSGGAAPLGKTGNNEGIVFFIPIVAFAIPLAAIAFMREHGLTGTWILAIAPALGFLNFAIAASTVGGEPGAWDRGLEASTLLTLLAVWLFLFACILATMRLLKNSGK